MSSVTSNTSLEQTTRVIVLCFLAFISIAASADTLTGKVVKITDGDTVRSGSGTLYVDIAGASRNAVVGRNSD